MTVCRPFNESTLDDFRHLFVVRFPDGDPAILETFLANPARKDHPATGAIAYDGDGSVKAILGLIPRRIYWGQTPLETANGVAIAVRKDADRAFFPDFIRNAVCRDGVGLFFVNTAIPPSRKRVKEVLSVLDGPESCSEIRERAVRSNGLLVRLVRKIGILWGLDRSAARLESAPYRAEAGGLTLTCETKIDGRDFDAFWERYLETNEGLVSSRTAEELRWMFGKGLASGEVVLLTARRVGGGALGDRPLPGGGCGALGGRPLPSAGVLQGYVFCRRTDETAACWRVVDFIAMKNDGEILTSLIEAVSDYLRRCTPAICLQITGFPMWVQPLLKRLFPKVSSFGFNKCIWVCLNERSKALCGDWVSAPNGWYGCPYDGDMCLM